MDDRARRAEQRLRQDIASDRHGTIRVVDAGEAMRREAEESERLRLAEERSFERGRQSVLRQLGLIRAEILERAGRSDIVGQWIDGVTKAHFLGDVIDVLERR